VTDVARTPTSTPANAPAVRPVTKVADSSTTTPPVRKSLPRTASSMPTIALIGALSLFAAALVAVRRRIA
jgi:LPXTG-motif cell wall-anchored protein